MIHSQPVFERWLMGGAVLVDPVDHPGLLRLDGTAAMLWDVVSGTGRAMSTDELTEALASEYAVAPDAIRADVAAAVERLIDHGAVHGDH